MAYTTEYTYNIDKKLSILIFCESDIEICRYEFDNNVITVSARDEVEVVNPTWGTNKDIGEWFNFLKSVSSRIELDEGLIRSDYEYEIELDDNGVKGILKIHSNEVADWEWNATTDTLTIALRNEQEINFTEFRLYVQWMKHFQYSVQNYGG